MLAFFIYFSYIALNLFITPNLDSLHTFTGTFFFARFLRRLYCKCALLTARPATASVLTSDKQAYILEYPAAPSKSIGERRYHPLISNSILLPLDAVPVLHDLPLGLINRVVLGDYRKREVTIVRKD